MTGVRRPNRWERRFRPTRYIVLASIAGCVLIIFSFMNLPASFVATVVILSALIVELWRHRRQAWALPALIVYLTVIVWYYADVVLYPERYRGMPRMLFDIAYGQVLIFALSFRVLVPIISWRIAPVSPVLVPVSLKPELMFKAAIVAWVLLFTCAVYRMDWDVVGALFPIDGRNGNMMWLRAAAGDAGPTGFLVSTGGYLYLVVCALFGIIFVLGRKPPTKMGALGFMLLTWPHFLLSGSRNQFLAVIMPCMFCYALLGRQKVNIRIITLVGCFLLVNFAFKIVIGYRNVGYRVIFEQQDSDVMAEGMAQDEKSSEHEGLNMIEELCYENAFLQGGQLQLTWGWDYFVQLTGFIPRAVWPGKPMMEMEYAKVRGFGGGDADIGVVATVSTGLIGQGVLEYGVFFGPVAPALLLALWCGLLARWWQQRVSLLRMGLFLLALGITFNLGRDITNIGLWPVIFAYLIVRLAEKSMATRPVMPEAALANAVARRAWRRRRPPNHVSAPRPAAAALDVAPVAGNGLPLS